MVKGDMLYLGMGSGPVTFAGAGRFYMLSAPAHATHPTRLIRIAEAATVTLGSPRPRTPAPSTSSCTRT